VKKYQVTVVRKHLDVYEVDATTERDATFAAALAMSEGKEPRFTKLVSRTPLKPTCDADKFERDQNLQSGEINQPLDMDTEPEGATP
jgi:hypothetical protein